MGETRKHALRFFLVRHGETAENIKMRYLGRRDAPLTEKGVRQAGQVAEALSFFPVRSIYTSPLKRTADTAAMIGEACGAAVCTDTRLIEGSFGRWEGLSRDEVIGSGGGDAALLARWERHASACPPGGESLEEIRTRVLGLVNELIENELQFPAVLVSHVGPIKALLASALDIPLEATRRLFLDPASISVVDWGPRPFLRLFNSHAHLGWSTPRWVTLPA
ncbi:MAG: histidine phosphatase family protein [Acidobacteria bacterium]|nr:histidine phosphatase family protein [Acidobacteriota bacterium]